MPRPRRFRRVGFEPGVTYFKPRGIRIPDLEESVLTVDEFEAVRLKDFEGLDQEEAAKKMNISQPTFHRLVLAARKRIADAIVNGKAIKIQGGNFQMALPMEKGMGFGGGRGRMSGFAAGIGGLCKCPKCGYEQAHARGIPCVRTKCPKCRTLMVRG